MAAQGRKLVVLSLLLAVVQRVAGQDLLIGNSRPCEDVVGADPDPNNPTDNLSCPRLDTELQCYPEAQLCDGVEQCAGGSDEGTNLVALTCEGKLVINSTSSHLINYFVHAVPRSASVFSCTFGEEVDLDALCDGNQDCTGGDDETTTLCESE